MSEEKNFNVGVVGYGMSAKVFHIPFINLTKGLILYSILQRSPQPDNSAPLDHPGVLHHTSLDALLADEALDLVVITTTPDTHYAFTKQALEAGKHVLVEKPFVPTSAEATELADLAQSCGKQLCVYQNRRWDADFATVQQLIQTGELGRIWEFETHFDRHRAARPTNWKGSMTMAQGGGVIYDLGTHLIDQVFALFGMPSTVSAKFVQQRDGRLVRGVDGLADEPDSVNAVLAYHETGLLVHVRIGVLSVEVEQPRFWVRGSSGSYRKTGLDPQEDQLKAGMTVTEEGFGRDSKHGYLCKMTAEGKVEETPYPNVLPPPTYLELYRKLARSLRSDTADDCPVPASQAVKVLKIIEAMQESAKTGTDVVPV